jgi:hypothetical protein
MSASDSLIIIIGPGGNIQIGPHLRVSDFACLWDGAGGGGMMEPQTPFTEKIKKYTGEDISQLMQSFLVLKMFMEWAKGNLCLTR